VEPEGVREVAVPTERFPQNVVQVAECLVAADRDGPAHVGIVTERGLEDVRLGHGKLGDPTAAALYDARAMREDRRTNREEATVAPITHSVEISRSPEDVFAYMSDLPRLT